ncbi:8870_t:CDS:2 [Entrophospora sp. SA101]|nr:8870_t:CDS:2 [Entrophospora sp. SA101]CAJ0844226.1 4132_t:CDS:2 [Entrophospora sp. SA101]
MSREFKFILENDPTSDKEEIIKNHNKKYKTKEVPRELLELHDCVLPCPLPPFFNINARTWNLQIKEITAITGDVYKMTEVSSFVGKKWSNESEVHKNYYKEMADETKALYDKEYAEFISNPGNDHVNLVANKTRKRRKSKITTSTSPPSKQITPSQTSPSVGLPYTANNPPSHTYININGELIDGNDTNNLYGFDYNLINYNNDDGPIIWSHTTNRLQMDYGGNDEYPPY